TLGDVLNAGWNLQGNGTAVDFVKPYDTVNFVNGTGTTVEVTTDDDNLTSTIKINTVMQYTDAAGNPVTKNENGDYVTEDGTVVPADEVQISTVNPDGTSTTPTKLGNVESSLNTLTKDIDTDGNKADGTPKTETKLVNLTESTVNPNTVATVGDLQNMGWIVKAQSNEYADVVKNANEVEFRGVGLNVSGETEAATGKRVITIKAESDILAELETELIKNGDPNATGEATLSGKIALKADNSASGYATAGNVKDMINYAGWQLHENGERKELINAGDQVNFVNGAGTVVSVTPISDSNDNNKTIGSNVTFNVDKGTITTETKDGTPTGKVVEASGTTPDKVATVQNVVNAINNSGFTLKTSATTDGTKVSGIDEIINPGDTVEMVAGKNLTVKQEADGKITYATKDDVEFNTVKIGDTSNNQPVVNLTTTTATPATNNPDGKAPTTALNITSTDGKPTQITGVGSVLDTTTVDGTAADKLVNLGTKDNPLPDSTLNSAATVRDLANMGWVVKASGDGYTDTVKNANVVDFVGENGITVTGETKADGTREIKVSLEKGEVVSTNSENPTYNGESVTKVGDKYYKTADLDPATGLPSETATPLTADEAKDVVNTTNKGAGFVSGNQVADAITQSGFTVGKNTDTTGVVFDNKDEKVNPNDNLRYADGKGTVVNLGTVKAIDENGVISTTTTVKVDVDTAKLETNADGTVKTPVTAEKAKELTDAITKAEEALKADPTNSDLQKALAAAEKAANDAGLNKIATAQDVANAINNSGWKATSGVEGTGEFASGNKTTSELINPGETVTLKAGDNLKIKQDGNNFTYSLNSNLKGLELVEVTDGTNTTTIKPGVIEGLTTTLEDNTTSGTKPADVTTTNAATLGDVLNAGWNLQENGQAKDFVKPYDTVNFVDGKGTVANVTTDGNVSNITFNIDTAKLENNTDGTVKDILSAADAKKLTDAVTDAKDNLKAAEKELANATTAAEKAEAAQKVAQAATKLSTAQKVANDAGLNKIATAQDVANAINNSGWNATSGTGVNGGEVTGTTKELVNPGETVTFDAGKNMKLVQEGNKFTYATKDDVEFTSIKADKVDAGTITSVDKAGNKTVINGGGVTITPEGVDSEKNPEKVVSITNKGVSAGGNKITNVAPGTEPNDAVNVSQLKGVEQNINNRMGDLDSKVNRGLAGAAALSGIEFMDIGINQATIAAAVGGYKGTHAVAVGMEAAPTENTRVNAKISLTPGSRVDSLYSVGAAYRFNWK
ncbi:YadA-like family protein, partial [Fusobacterium gastrosuis]|uniref:YadA-like family protein n=1 Tax=Fusobacterium gastrosuis TaxID=1755100 RepID=UPI002A9EEB70|nr:YadA-like family protein [Fusobacterium gastrosuis]